MTITHPDREDLADWALGARPRPGAWDGDAMFNHVRRCQVCRARVRLVIVNGRPGGRNA